MQLLITHASMARSRVVNLSRWQLAGMLLALMLLFLLASGTIYHFIFLKAAREGWPVVSQIVRLVVRDEIAQRDRFMRENLDAMAQKVGDMQAKLVKLEAMGERVIGLAGVKSEELKPLKRPAGLNGGAAAAAGTAGGAGGPYLPLEQPSLTQLQATVDSLDLAVDQNTDIFTLIESRLLESRLQALMVPSSAPVNVAVGSGFGIRPDPFTGHASLHTGLDFPAEVGTPVHAAAGGIVTMREWHPAYGNTLEIDHGNGLVTRYAHCAGFEVERGALVKRGQLIARVGTTGRSTGPHLHFEVLVDGSPQNPQRFLAGGGQKRDEKRDDRREASAAGTAPIAVGTGGAPAGAAPLSQQAASNAVRASRPAPALPAASLPGASTVGSSPPAGTTGLGTATTTGATTAGTTASPAPAAALPGSTDTPSR